MLDVVNEYPLFCVICGGNDENKIKKTAGYRWARENGAPVEILNLDGCSAEKVLDRLVKVIDYAVIAYDGENSLLRRLIMNMKAAGKHGKVIKYDKK